MSAVQKWKGTRELEAEAGNEEDHAGDGHRVCCQAWGDVVEIECAGGGIEKADAVEHYAGRESGGEDELRCCL